MSNRLPTLATRDCRYCGKTLRARGITSHETRYCPHRPAVQVDEQVARGAQANHEEAIAGFILQTDTGAGVPILSELIDIQSRLIHKYFRDRAAVRCISFRCPLYLGTYKNQSRSKQ